MARSGSPISPTGHRWPRRLAASLLLAAALGGNATLAGATPPPVDPGNGGETATSPHAADRTPVPLPTADAAVPTVDTDQLAVGGRAIVSGPAGNPLQLLAAANAVPTRGQVPAGAIVAIIDGPRGDWYDVGYAGLEGWVPGARLIPVVLPDTAGASVVPSTVPATSVGSATPTASPVVGTAAGGTLIAGMALRYLGVPYAWGGGTPAGWDCSGFVVYIYRAVTGQTLPRTTQLQWAVGTPVSREAIAAGDLVFFQGTDGPGITHVGIAIGDGRFVHASSPGVGTVIGDLADPYYAAHYAGARRP